MAEILYLDIDDEITSAAAHIRSAREVRVALVLPAGSRLATSRINFRLLAREAQARHRNLSIVAPEGAARALAASAGLAAFATVGEFEDAAVGTLGERIADDQAPTDAPPSQAEGAARKPTGRDAGLRAPEPQASRAGRAEGVTGAAGADSDNRATRPEDRHPSLPVVASRKRSLGRTLVAILAGFVVLALAAGGVSAYLLLPSATIVVHPHDESIGPLHFTVRADPTVTAVDAQRGVVPAQLVTFPLSVKGQFPATAKRVDESKATATVRFRNCDPGNSYRVRAGSVVSTAAGIRFSTDGEVFLPVAIFDPSTSKVTCQGGEVNVTAWAAGPAGNVGPGTITRVPANVNANLVFVTNPAPAAGGTHEEFPKVAQKDVDKARASLARQLAALFDAQLADPSSVPAGATLFPQTRSMSQALPSVDPGTLVDQEIDTFELGLSATGTVVTVDTAAVQQVGEERLRSGVAAGRTLVDGSTQVVVGDPTVEGQVVAFPVSATARQARQLDEGQLLRDVKGKSVSEARTILADYGEVQIDVWPGWVTSIPSFDFRLDLRVVGAPAIDGSPGASAPAPTLKPTPAPIKSAKPLPSPRPTATVRRSPAPSARPSGSSRSGAATSPAASPSAAP